MQIGDLESATEDQNFRRQKVNIVSAIVPIR